MLVRMWLKGNTCTMFLGMQIGRDFIENSIENRFLKKLKIELQYDPAIPLLGIYLKKKKKNSKRYMHPNGHSNIIDNCQDMETNCLSTDEWIKNVVYM